MRDTDKPRCSHASREGFTVRNAIVVALAALAVACPGPEPAHPAPEVSSVTAFCQAVLDVDVQKIVACTGASEADAAAVWGVETAGACDALTAAVAAGMATYRPDEAPSCLAALERAPCDTFEDGPEPAECARVLVGATAPGGACDADYECAGGSCRPSQDPCTDVCVADLPAGASCRNTFASCGPGLGCDFAGSGTCVPATPGQIGATCGLGAEPCVLEAYCDAGGICRAKLPAGSSCLDAYDACVPGTLCDDEDAYPVSRAECVPWVGQGAACGPF